MQNNNKRYIFNDILIHIEQSKYLLTGKNGAKKRRKEKNGDKKQYVEDMTTFRGKRECYIIQTCIKQMNNYSEQCARRKENELEKS